MIYATGKRNGRTFLLIGLSFDNLDYLRAHALDGYINIDGNDLGIYHDIIITSGKTEHELFDLLKDRLIDGAVVHFSDKMKSSS